MGHHIDVSSVCHRAMVCFVVALVSSAALMAPVAGSSPSTAATTDADGPSVDTAWADVLNDTAVIVAANLTDFGDTAEADVWFEYRENGSDERWAASAAERTNSTGAVTDHLTGLEPGTQYEYRAVAETSTGIDRGEPLTIRTLADRPEATTTGTTDIGTDEATLVTDVTDLGGKSSAEVWFSYSRTDDDEPHSDWAETPKQTVESTGAVSQLVDGLESGTEYEFTSHIRTEEEHGLSTGYERFTTETPFTVETGVATVEETRATLTGEITDFGGAESATAEFEYRPDGASNWTATESVDPGSAGQVSADVADLEPGTDYEFRVVGAAADGDSAVGAIEAFATLADPAVETGSVTAVDDESATVTGELADLGGADSATVAIQYRAAGETAWHESDGETLTTTGTFDAAITGLESGTEYEYRAVVRADGTTETGATTTLTTDVGAHEPTVDVLSGSEDSSPNPHAELAVDWRVTDADGDLSSVSVTIRDGSGQVVDRTLESVGGDVASGSLTEGVKHGAGDTYEVTLEVEDGTETVVTERTTIEA
ncbi:fibronectin type III domain-containing protein [Natronorubrum sp. FCH18a]|uniref:fibronectin type III domain-containing protein n=1 Tax=Natronorubrum sp. FCH18a TaxID=3447018 RepID=UPI003F51A194